MGKSSKYIEYLLGRKCFPDFLEAMGHKADPKEWSECVGMLWRVKDALNRVQWDKVDVLLDVGCGKRPTLGVLVGLNIKSIKMVYSIDPQLDMFLPDIAENLFRFRETIQDLNTSTRTRIAQSVSAIICCNHAHVKLSELQHIFKLFKKYIYITSPCCVDNRPKKGLYYRDNHVWSPKNEYYTYFGGNEK